MTAISRILALLVLLLTAPAAFAQQKTELPERVLGKADAPITIVEYASLTCPHCADFHTNTLPQVKKEWIDTGKAKLIYRDFPLDGAALGAAILAQCAGEQRYFPVLATMFQTQGQWTREQSPMKALQNTLKLAGVTEEQSTACLNDKGVMDAIRARQLEAQQKYNIDSTPTFLVNGKKVNGAASYEEFAKVLKAESK